MNLPLLQLAIQTFVISLCQGCSCSHFIFGLSSLVRHFSDFLLPLDFALTTEVERFLSFIFLPDFALGLTDFFGILKLRL